MAIKITYGDVGLASFDTDTIESTGPLFAGEADLISEPRLIAAGQVLPMGSALAENAEGVLVLIDTGEGIGAQVVAVTTSNVDTSAGEQELAVWTTGYFNVDALTFGAGYTTTSQKLNAFRGSQVHARKVY